MNTADLKNWPLGTVEGFYNEAIITADQWEGYRHAWATGAPRFGDWGAWSRHEFSTVEAERIAVGFGCCGGAR